MKLKQQYRIDPRCVLTRRDILDNSGFTNVPYGVNIGPDINVYLHNVRISHYNNFTTKSLPKNDDNLTLSEFELTGNTISVFNNQAGSLAV